MRLARELILSGILEVTTSIQSHHLLGFHHYADNGEDPVFTVNGTLANIPRYLYCRRYSVAAS